MGTPEYAEVQDYVSNALSKKNHPKLKKLSEILVCFFSDEKHRESSKVIIFTQYRECANEINSYIQSRDDTRALVKSDVFLG